MARPEACTSPMQSNIASRPTPQIEVGLDGDRAMSENQLMH